MAAVQPTPAMQQQVGNNGGPVNSVLPQGMSKEQIHTIYKVRCAGLPTNILTLTLRSNTRR